MNHIYKVIFNKAIGAFVAVAEFAKAHGKSSSGTVGSIDYPKLAGKRFAFTAVASSMILLSNPALAATGSTPTATVTSGNTIIAVPRINNTSNNICYYDANSRSVICGDATTTNNTGNNNTVLLGIGASIATTAKSDGSPVSANGNVSIGANSKADGSVQHGVRGNPEYTRGSLAVDGTTVLKDDKVPVTRDSKHNSSSTAVGHYSEANNGGTAIGHGTDARALGVAIGALAKAGGTDNDGVSTASSVAIGAAATATGESSIAIGRQTVASGSFASAIGNVAGAKGISSFAVGHSTLTEGNRSIAIGTAEVNKDSYRHVADTQTYTKSDDSIALGTAARVESDADNAIAMGTKAKAEHKNSVALGSGSATAAASDQTAAVTINNLSYGTFAGKGSADNGSISVGTTGKERQIKNVAAGAISSTSTDAINGSQLHATNTVLGNLANSIKTEFGGNAALGADGKITFSDIGGTKKDNIHEAIIAVTEKVVHGKNANVTSNKDAATGATTFTVDANDTVITQGTGLSVSGGTLDANRVKTYTIGLDANTQTAVTNANNAIQSFDTQVNGNKVKTVTKTDNKVNFVNGANTTAKASGTDITFDVNVDNKTIETNSNKQLQAKTVTLTENTTTRGIIANPTDTSALIKATDVATAINTVGFNIKANGGDKELVRAGEEVNFANGNGIDITRSGKTITVGLNPTTQDQIKKEESVKAGNTNLTVTGNGTNDTGGKEYTVTLNNNLNLTDGGSIQVGGITANNTGINMGNKKITNLTAGTADADAVNVSQLKGAKTKVVKGTNIVDVAEQTDSNTHQTTYTINAKGTTVDKGSEYVTVNSADAGSNVTKYTVDLSDKTKTTLGKADTAMQGFTTQVNSTDKKTIGNNGNVKFVDGDNIAITRSGDDIKVSTKKEVTFDKVTSKNVTVGNVVVNENGINAGNKNITNVAAGTANDHAVNYGQLKEFEANITGKQIGVKQGKNVTITNEGTTSIINAEGTSVSHGSDLISVKADPRNADTHITNYKVDLSDKAKTAINNANTALQSFTTTVNGQNSTTINQGNNTIDFANGVATTAVKSGNGVKYDVKYDNATIKLNNQGQLYATLQAPKTTTLSNNDKGVVAIANGGNQDFVLADTVAGAINNSGFVVQGNGGVNKLIKTGKNVNFVNGNVTTATVTANGDNANVKFDVKTGDGITIADGKLKANVDGTTITIADGKLKANYPETTNLEVKDGKVTEPADANKGKVVSASQIANAINKTGFNIQANGGDKELVVAGDSVNFKNGKNITVTRTGKNIEVKTNDNVTFTKVTSNDVVVGPVTINKDTGINAGDKKITKVATGTDNTDAVNVKQLKDEIGKSTMQYTGDNGDVTVKRTPSQVLTIKGGATNGTTGNIKTVADANGSVEVQLSKDIKALDSITTNGGVKIDNAGIDAGKKVISNVATGVKGTDAVNVDQLNKFATDITSKQIGVEAGTNVKIDKKGTMVVVNADGASVSNGSDLIDVKADAKNTQNITNYKVDLSDKAKTAINNANTALQSFDAQVNGATAKTVTKTDNKVNFVNGTGTTAENKNGTIAYNVNKANVTVKDGVASNDKKGDTFVTGDQVVNVVNSSGFNVQVTDADKKLVKNGDTVKFIAGDNINITHSDKNITIKTGNNVKFTTVTTDGINTKEGTVANDDPKKTYITEGGKNIVNGGDVYNYVTNTVANSETQYTGDNSAVVIKRKPSDVLTIKGGAKTSTENNIMTVANTDGSISVKLAKEITGVDSIKTGDVTVGKDGIDAGGKVITNVANGKDGKDAVNVDQLNEEIKKVTTTATAAKTEVVKGTNVASVEKSQGGAGQDIYTVNADGAKVSGTDKFVTVTAGAKDAKNVTDYKVDLAKEVKDSLGKADSAIQSFDAQVNGTTAKTVTKTDNKVNFVNGTGTTAENKNGTIAYNVNKANVTVKDGVASNDKKGDTFVTGDQVVEVVNSTGFNTAVNGKDTVLVKNGNTVNFKDGSNIEITRNKEGDIVVSTTKNAGFDTVTVGDKVTINNNGINAGDTKITNVKDGDISKTSTDAVNGKQIHEIVEKINNATNAAKTEVQAGTNTQVTEAKGKDGQTVYTVHADKAVTAQGDGVIVTSNTVEDTNKTKTTTYTVALSDETKKQLGKEESVVAGNNITVTGDKLNSTGGKEYTVALNNNLDLGDKGSVKMGDVSISNTGLDNGGNKITNIGKGDVSANSTDAVNGSQLHEVKELVTNSGFNIQANGGDKEFVKNGETVNFKEGDNVTITRDGKDITVTTKKDVSFDSVKVGDVTINNNGINAGNKVISNVADGIKPSDAVNVKQLKEANDSITKTIGGKIETITQTIEKNGKKETVQIQTIMKPNGQPLHTYNVYGQTEYYPADIVSAIDAMNEQGIRFFHVNDGVAEPISVHPNTIDSSARGNFSAAIGYKSRSDGTASVALGNESKASGSFGVAIGHKSIASLNAVAMGTEVEAGVQSIAIGDGSKATGRQSIAIGTKNVVTGNHSGAFGDPNLIVGDNSYSIGNDNAIEGIKTSNLRYRSENIQVSGSRNTIGARSINRDENGKLDQVNPDVKGVTPVKNVTVNGFDNTVYAGTSRVLENTHVVGSNNTVTSNNTFVLGSNIVTDADGKTVDNSVYLGNNTTVTAGDKDGIYNLTADGKLGSGRHTTAGATGTAREYAPMAKRSKDSAYFPEGYAAATAHGAVSVGAAGSERRVQNVAAGEVSYNSTDAINGSQLYAAIEMLGASYIKVDAGRNIDVKRVLDNDGTIVYQVHTEKDVTFDNVTADNVVTNNLYAGPVVINNNGINAGNTQITNVADGVNDTDAVNMGQMNRAINGAVKTEVVAGENTIVERGVGENGQNVYRVHADLDPAYKRIDNVKDEANAGISSAMAMASLPQAYMPGKSMLTGGVATYNGEGAVAVGLSKLSDNGRWVLKMSGSADTQGNLGGAVGAGFHF